MSDHARQSQPDSTEAGASNNPSRDTISPVREALKRSTSLSDSNGSNERESRARENLEPTLSTSSFTLPPIDPVTIQIRDLSVEVDVSPSAVLSRFTRKAAADAEAQETTKSILTTVSANFPSGALTAIIGGSGSGKTSFLNTVAERMTSGRWKIGGITAFNGRKGIGSSRCAYVMQNDVLLPMLTIRETLVYSADLRLAGMTREARRDAVEAVILELGLKECADTRVGNNVHKGCSGGEKRRCSIGVQLLSNPSVLFLDEPTTGLDSTSAYQLIRTLKGLAKKDRTIITTIHQPRSEIWGLFDQFVILSRGSPVYSGPAAACLPYFSHQGYDLPAFINPAEFLIDIAAVDNRSPELEASSKARVDQLKSAWLLEGQQNFGPISLQEENDISEKRRTWNGISTRNGVAMAKRPIGFFRQLSVLTSRTLKITYRDPMGMSGSIIEAILMALTTGLVYLQLSEDQSGIRSREGALYTACALQGYLILLFEIFRLSIDVELFDRERGEGVVDVLPWMLSRRLARLFTEDIPVPLLYSIIFYFLAGFRADGAQFLTFFTVVLLTQYIAVCYAMACISVTRSFAGASLIGNMGYTVQSMACGFFIQSNTIPVYVRWLKWVAYVYYAFGALCANEFQGHFYDCPFEGGPANPQCENYKGSFIMASLGFPQTWITRPIIALLAFVIMFYTVAGFTFRYWTVGMNIAQARNSDTDYSAGKEKLSARSLEDVRTVNIYLDKFALQLDKKRILGFGRKVPRKTILEPVTAQFQAGILNVIMGPSGSGKTSLLNAMALRTHGTLTTKYRQGGSMTFNGAEPSDSVVRSVVSYVCQDDDALLPSLTVRETLRFSAGLRLPKFMSAEEKNRKAEEVLLKMGLKDCADNIIGSELIKGVSGGEKRRVTIAVQILTDPRVLILDEPTSGLDAFTASSIMSVLKGLAAEGRTLILTIHQSRSDLFPAFGNVLLLARGGSPVYSGPGHSMLAHFSSLGYPCPRTTNPADFALDIITVDLQHSTREAESRAKVRSLINSWHGMEGIRMHENASIATPAELGALKRRMAAFHISYPILVRRAFINLSRQPDLVIARLMQVVGLGIILTIFFSPLRHDYFSIQNRVGFIQEFCAFYFVGMLQNIAIYPAERDVFYREDDDRAYSVEGFFLQYLSLEVPFEVVTSIIFAVLVDLGAGLPRTAQVFWVCFFNCLCIVNCGESVGIMFNTLFSHSGFAVNIISVFLSIAQLMSGIMSINMPVFLQDINYISPIRYSIRNLAPYTLQSIMFTCAGKGEARNTEGSCVINSGNQVLELYDLNADALVNLIGLGVTTVIYRLVAYGLLKFMRRK